MRCNKQGEYDFYVYRMKQTGLKASFLFSISLNILNILGICINVHYNIFAIECIYESVHIRIEMRKMRNTSMSMHCKSNMEIKKHTYEISENWAVSSACLLFSLVSFFLVSSVKLSALWNKKIDLEGVAKIEVITSGITKYFLNKHRCYDIPS